MKVQGSAPGQVVDLAETQERQRLDGARRTARRAHQESTGVVRPAHAIDRSEEERREATRGLQRFLDWISQAQIKKGTKKTAQRSPPGLESYKKALRNSYSQSQKGQRVSLMA